MGLGGIAVSNAINSRSNNHMRPIRRHFLQKGTSREAVRCSFGTRQPVGLLRLLSIRRWRLYSNPVRHRHDIDTTDLETSLVALDGFMEGRAREIYDLLVELATNSEIIEAGREDDTGGLAVVVSNGKDANE